MKCPTESTAWLLVPLLLPLLGLGSCAVSVGGGRRSQQRLNIGSDGVATEVLMKPDGKAAERAAAHSAAAVRRRSAVGLIAADGTADNDGALGSRVSYRRSHQYGELDGIAPLTAAYHRRKRDDDIDNSIAPQLMQLLDQSPTAAKTIGRSHDDPRQFVSSPPIQQLRVAAGVSSDWEGRDSSSRSEEAISPLQSSQTPPPQQQQQQNAAALLAAMSRVRLIDHQTGERVHQRPNSGATAPASADGSPLAVSDQAADLRPELCRALPVRQAVSHGGCFRRYVSNRMCAGQCNSVFVPSEGVRQQHPVPHRPPTQLQRQRIAAAAASDDGDADLVDSEPQQPSLDGFSSCTWCKPVKTSTRSVVLFCPQGASLRRFVKRYAVVEQCKCSMHRSAAGEPPTAQAGWPASDLDSHDDQPPPVSVETPQVDES